MTARNWRPHMLVFVSNVEKRLDLSRFGAWFAENRGVVSICELYQGDILELNVDVVAREQQINAVLKSHGIVAFGDVNIVQDLERGVLAVAQSNGIAGMASNTVLVGWPDDGDEENYAERLAELAAGFQNCFFVHNGSLFLGDLVTPEQVE